jgi:putative sugar O-methyltransferase
LVSRYLYRDIKKDKLFNNTNIYQCFQERNNNISNPEIIERIIKSYNLAKLEQEKLSSIYGVSNEWIPIYNLYMVDIIEALKSKNKDKVSKIYNNFMREDCSVGLHGLPVNMKLNYFSQRITIKNRRKYLIDFIYRLRLWKSLVGNLYNLESLSVPDIGNPYGLVTDEMFLKTGAEYQHYYAHRIKELTKQNEVNTILEIGAGYGGLAYYLLKDTENLKYIDIDLPENMALTAYYLLNLFPEKKILLYGEDEITESTIKEYDILILPNFCIDKVSDGSCNLVFNSYSLAEMSKETIDFYIEHIMRVTKEYFLHINHNKNSLVVADDFGIDPKTFSLMYKVPARWNYGRNINMDEFEYLYSKL